MLALGCGGTALGLDPNHKLTQYLHRTWQTQAGLAQASIYVVTQTHDGYLWVGTQSGVVRFDGVEFKPVRALQEKAWAKFGRGPWSKTRPGACGSPLTIFS